MFLNSINSFFGCAQCLLTIQLLLHLAWDVRPNPGPKNTNKTNQLSVIHINVRSLQNKIDILACDIENHVIVKDQLKRQLAQAGISHQSWQQEASDRDSWRSSVKKASCEFETERLKAAKQKRRRQKERASHPSSSQTFVCPKCGRRYASRIGLYSHQRACKN